MTTVEIVQVIPVEFVQVHSELCHIFMIRTMTLSSFSFTVLPYALLRRPKPILFIYLFAKASLYLNSPPAK